jgi:secreted trypsin-like serine protease
MRKRVLLPTLLVLAAVAAGVYALSPQPGKAVTGGSSDGNQHPYVGLVTDRDQACSGSLVSPTRFITAAHCFSQAGQRVEVTIHPEGARAADPDYVSGTWIPNPNYCGECPSGSTGFALNDIAVVQLDAPLNPERFARIPSVGAVDTLADGQDLVVVGYGVQSFSISNGAAQPNAAFTRFFGQLDLVGDNPVSGRFVRARSAQGSGGGACFGDSGGPVLIEDVIVGVNSFVTSDVCDGDTFAHRLDTAAAQAFLAQHGVSLS